MLYWVHRFYAVYVGFLHSNLENCIYTCLCCLKTVFDLTKYTSASDMLSALNKTSLIGSSTDTPAALSAGLTLFRTGGRSSAVQVMLLVTDGHGAVDNSWANYYYGNISLISSTTKIQRFGKELGASI
jgi:hypothetical protein